MKQTVRGWETPQRPQQCCRLKSNLGSSGPSSGGGGGGADMTSINSRWLTQSELKGFGFSFAYQHSQQTPCRLCMPPGHLVACSWASGCSRVMAPKRLLNDVERVMCHNEKNSDCQLSHFGCLECVLNMLRCLTWSVHRRVMHFYFGMHPAFSWSCCLRNLVKP